jgi:hypothetical protein
MASKLLAISEQVCRLVAQWDVLNEDGSMFPLRVEQVAAEIPLAFQNAVIGAAIGAVSESGAVGEAKAPEGQAASA